MRKRLWSEGLVILLLFLLPAGLLLAAYQRASQVTVDLSAEAQPPDVHLQGFYAPEQSNTFSFRWSQGQAQIRLTALGWGRTLQLEVGLIGWRDPAGQPVTATISVNEQVLARFPVGPMAREQYKPPRYTFLVSLPFSFSGDLTIHLQSSTFSAGERDERHLGLAVDQLTVRCDRGRGWPPLQVLLSLQGTILLLYISVRVVGQPRRLALALAGGSLLLLAISLIVAGPWVVPYLPVVAGVITGLCVSFSLVRAVLRANKGYTPLLTSAVACTRQAGRLLVTRFIGQDVVPREYDALIRDVEEKDPSRVKRDILAVCLLLAVVLGFFYREVFLGRVFWSGDISWFFYPGRILLADALRHFDFSTIVWNPYLFGGYPLLAEGQIGAFYPINWVVLPFLSGFAGYTALVVGHYFLAGLFMYLYARVLKMSWLGAIVSALAFMFHGFLLVHLPHMSLMNAAVWLPLVFLFAERWILRKRACDIALCGLTLAIQLLAGHPQSSIMTAFAVGLYIPFRTLWLSSEHRLRRFIVSVGVVILVLLIGVGLSAAQLLPEWELVQLSPRAGAALDLQEAVIYSLPPENLVTFVEPFFFGGPWYGYWGKPHFGEFALYVGALPVVLAVTVLFLRRDSRTVFFLLLAALSLLLALGGATPAYALLHKLPILSGIRVPSRFVHLADFALAVLGGLGLTYLPYIGVSNRRRRLQILAGLLMLVGLVLFVVESGLVLSLRDLFAARPVAPTCIEVVAEGGPDHYCSFLPLLVRHADVPGATDTAASLTQVARDLYDRFSPYLYLFWGGLLLLLAGRTKRGVWLQIICVGLTLMDLFMFAQRLTTAPLVVEAQQALAEPSSTAAEFLEASEGFGRAYSIMGHFANDLAPYHIFSFDGYSPLDLERHNDYEQALRTSGYRTSLLSLAGVRYVVDYDGLLAGEEAEQRGLRLVYQHDRVWIYENPAVLPKAFIVHSVHIEKLDPLHSLWKDLLDPAREVLLEEDFDTTLLAKAGQERVDVTDYAAMKVVVQTSSDSGGLLVLGDTYYPGWKAYVDGQETEIYRANYLFRAVYMPPGDHTVEFVYRPTTLYVGLAISLLTLTGVVGFLIGTGLASRRRWGALERGRRKSDAALDSDSSVE